MMTRWVARQMRAQRWTRRWVSPRRWFLASLTCLAVWACATAQDEIGAGDSPTTGGSSSNNSSSQTSSASVSSSNSSSSGSGGSSSSSATSGGGGQAGESPSSGSGGDSSASGGSGQIPPEVLENADVVVECFFENTEAMTNRIFAHFFLRNQSTDALPLDGAELRYWLDPDGVSYALDTFHAGTDLGGFPDLSSENDGEFDYISLKFKSGGSLPPGNDPNASESQMQLQASSGTFDQSNDHSFNASLNTRGPNDKVTFYIGGKLLWGCEPSGVCAGDELGQAGAAN